MVFLFKLYYMIKIWFIIFLLFKVQTVFGQNTVGTISWDKEQSLEGYNMIYPHNQSTVFLLNNCGETIHSWTDEDNFRPGNTAYLLENGNLVKTKRGNSPINDPIWAGGGGEFVEIRDWENNLISSYFLNDSTARLHHDVAVIDNGNILMVAWELKSKEEAIEAGRRLDLLANDVLWSEMILEWNPFTDEIIWEWHAWDHLIQENDSLSQNFGKVSEHPELIDINYDEHDGHQDWLHINSIDYNSDLDQIVVSVPYFNELWIIDHSTNITEAASHSGGTSGKGGDIIYRWGNPAAYASGDINDKMLFFQHDVKWVVNESNGSLNNSNQISLYNNRVNDRYSSINQIQTDFNFATNTYELVDGVFGPEDFESTIVHPDTLDITLSTGLSSAQYLSNGNTLTLSGRWGYAYELNSNNEVVWEYRVPLRGGSPVDQGTDLTVNNNITFRMDRYSLDFPAFIGKDLPPGQRLELIPNSLVCDVISDTEDFEINSSDIRLLGNPTYNDLNLISERDGGIEIIDSRGSYRKRIEVKRGYNSIDLKEFSSGMIFLKSTNGEILKFVLLR